MKFDGPLLEAETDARAAIRNFFTYFDVRPKTLNGPGAYETLCDQMMQFAKAGFNHAIEKMAGEIQIEFQPELLKPGPMHESMVAEIQKQIDAYPQKAKRYPIGHTAFICDCNRAAGEKHAPNCSIRRNSGPVPCGEIPLGKPQVCELATGTLEVPHTACQICGEVVNAIGHDRFGYSHPKVHENSSFGFSSEYFPINPSGYEHIHEYQSESRIHRRSAEVKIEPIDESSVMKTLKNKRETLEAVLAGKPFSAMEQDTPQKQTLTEYLKAHPCKGFQIRLFYLVEGDFIQVYFENVPSHTEDVAKNVAIERAITASNLGRSDSNRIVGVKLFGMGELGLLHLDPDEIKFLIAELSATSFPRTPGTFTDSILKKLERMKPPCNECGGGGYGQYGRPGDMPCRQCNS